MCNENDREIIRIDFQIMDLKKELETSEEGSSHFKKILEQIEKLEELKRLKKAE